MHFVSSNWSKPLVPPLSLLSNHVVHLFALLGGSSILVMIKGLHSGCLIEIVGQISKYQSDSTRNVACGAPSPGSLCVISNGSICERIRLLMRKRFSGSR